MRAQLVHLTGDVNRSEVEPNVVISIELRHPLFEQVGTVMRDDTI